MDARAARGLLGGSPLVAGLALLTLALALMFGGGRVPGLRSDALVQLASLALLFSALMELSRRPLPRLARFGLALAAAALLLPLVQLIPLPPAIWTALPGRDLAVESFAAAGLASPWWPLSLDPAATWRSFLTLLPAAAMFVAVQVLDARARRLLVLLAMAIGIIAVLLGLAQLMQGPSSPLRFYEITNRGSSVGFFANRNHHAAFLYCLIPFTVAFAAALIGRSRTSLPVIWSGLFIAALLLGAAMSLSRTGAALAAAALVISLAMLGDAGRSRRDSLNLLLIVGAGAALLVIHYALGGLVARFERDPLQDYRWDILAISIETLRSFSVVGSGFGTFEQVYLIHDRSEALRSSYVNHVHNDWLEILIEGGLPALVVVGGFVAWFIATARAAWRPVEADRLDVNLRRAASIAILLLLLHSLVEFPLRTTALLSLFAMSCALMLPAPERPVSGARPRRRQAKREGRHRTSAGRWGETVHPWARR